MATRNLEHPRDRFLTMLVIPFVTCSARSVVILALVGKYLGPLWAAAMYLLSIVIGFAVSWFISRLLKNAGSGLVMEVPPLRRPYPLIIAKKVWFRLREFVVVAWPVILISSVLLQAASFYGIDDPVNRALAPLTVNLLKLPVVVGISLFLGIFRKELTLLMLAAALGTTDIGAVLSQAQILTLVVFIMLYIPCVATLSVLWKEGGFKTCATSALLNFGVALVVASVVARVF
jgi:ferrous iron transport protein B